jgi:hypothetical protein
MFRGSKREASCRFARAKFAFCSRPDVQGVKTADAAAAGMVELSGAKYQKVQFLTVEEILDGRKPRLPFPEMPDVFKKADVAAPKGLEV